MLTTRERIVEGACMAWEHGNIAAALADFSDDVEFSVHAPSEAASLVGGGRGKAELTRRLGGYLDNFQVRYYEVLHTVVRSDDCLRCGVRFVYRHRWENFEIEGTMRHLWRFDRNDKVVRLDIFYDAQGMRAFYDLIDRASSGA